MKAPYRYEVTNVHAMVQQLATSLIPKGYWYYKVGYVKPGKAVEAVDQKLIEKYDIAVSSSTRARRKAAGRANLQYLRIRGERWFLLIGTGGEHRFREEEDVRDIRRDSLLFGGYSICYQRGGFLRKADKHAKPIADPGWHARVQISKKQFAELRAEFWDVALRHSAEAIGQRFGRIPFEPYARVRQQILELLLIVNDRRKLAGLELVSMSACRFERHILKPFTHESIWEAA